jgi:N-acetylglutamate synthase-like GNAT family acetyltransferase
MVTIREGDAADVERVDAFYESQRRGRPAAPDDFLLLAENDAHEIVGVVRLCQEEGYRVLRGMLIERDYRRQGLGTRILRALEPHLRGQDCYCLPWGHLETFYAMVGFETANEADLPTSLRERLTEHDTQMRDARIQQLMQDDLGVHPPNGLVFIAMKRPRD